MSLSSSMNTVVVARLRVLESEPDVTQHKPCTILTFPLRPPRTLRELLFVRPRARNLSSHSDPAPMLTSGLSVVKMPCDADRFAKQGV